jgi:AraC-like DNA-binding protein
MSRVTTPLRSHGVLHTTSVDYACKSVAASLAPHRLATPRGADSFVARHNAATLDLVSVHFIDYGTEVEVTADRLDFHLVQIPLGGLITIAAGSRTSSAGPRSATVTGPGEPVRMRYSAGNPRLMVRLSPELVCRRQEVAAAGGLVVPLQPNVSVDLSAGAGRSWRGLVDLIIADLERDDGLTRSPIAAATFQTALADGLIAALAAPARRDADGGSLSERIVRRAARLIEDHCAEPLGTPDIAESVGVSTRALQAGFRARLGTTPMAYLRRARLARVHDMLMDGSAHSVAEAAHRWGVTHLGRLSGDYRAAFGESPSETLARSH